jgi:hypothetical protein
MPREKRLSKRKATAKLKAQNKGAQPEKLKLQSNTEDREDEFWEQHTARRRARKSKGPRVPVLLDERKLTADEKAMHPSARSHIGSQTKNETRKKSKTNRRQNGQTATRSLRENSRERSTQPSALSLSVIPSYQ